MTSLVYLNPVSLTRKDTGEKMFLYKYMPLIWSDTLSDEDEELNQKRCDCIEGNRFWFSKPDLLNDPYDCKPLFTSVDTIRDVELILDGLDAKDLNIIMETYPQCRSKSDILSVHNTIFKSSETNQNTKAIFRLMLQIMTSTMVSKKMANVGILSMTTDYSNCVMWSHYAKNHQGICLEIDIPEYTQSLNSVTYTEQQPTVAVYEATNEKHGKLIDLFYKKSWHWKGECEWRMVTHIGNIAKEIPDTRVTRVIYGLNTSEQTKEKLRKIMGNHIEGYQIRMKRNYVLN